ncbi:MAG: class B sortase [Anaerovoracaceae bacterium]
MNKKKQWFFRITIAILIMIICFSGYKVYTIISGYQEGTKEYDEIKKVAGIKEDSHLINIDFDKLKKQNKEIFGWLYSKNTKINYPVVQGSNNQKYLYTIPTGEVNGKGSLFIDFRCKKNFGGFNTIIYGHHMKDGSMFACLDKYKNQSYYNKHKNMVLLTPTKRYTVEIFAAATIPADGNQYTIDFATKESKKDYLDLIREESLIDTDVTMTADDKMLMLSTCAYDFEDARFVVYGKLSLKTEE